MMDDPRQGPQRTESERTREVANAFGEALAAEDLGTVAGLLAPACVYEAGDARHEGRDAILESLRIVTREKQIRFDETRRHCGVRAPSGPTALIEVTDYLLKAGGRWQRYRHHEEVTVYEGTIVRIVRHELPGELEAFVQYLVECGIEPE